MGKGKIKISLDDGSVIEITGMTEDDDKRLNRIADDIFYCNVKYVPRPLYSDDMEYRSNWNEEEFD